jgi:hypothetical protein
MSALLRSSSDSSSDSKLSPSAATMIRAISRMSSSTMPRVVRAGVPIRNPDGFIGSRSSNGMALRFTVIPTSSNRSSAILPSSPVEVRSTKQVHVGAAGEDVDASRHKLLGESLGVGYRLPLAGAEALGLGEPLDLLHGHPVVLTADMVRDRVVGPARDVDLHPVREMPAVIQS